MLLNNKVLKKLGWEKRGGNAYYTNERYHNFIITTISFLHKKISSNWGGNFSIFSNSIENSISIALKTVDGLIHSYRLLDSLNNSGGEKINIEHVLIENKFIYDEKKYEFIRGSLTVWVCEPDPTSPVRLLMIKYGGVVIMRLRLITTTKCILEELLDYLSWYVAIKQ